MRRETGVSFRKGERATAISFFAFSGSVTEERFKVLRNFCL